MTEGGRHGTREVPIESLDPGRRALRVCRQLGVRTVADFQRRDRSEFLAVRGCGPRTYARLEARVRAFVAAQAPEPVAPAAGFAQLSEPLLAGLTAEQAELLRLRLGLGGPPLRVQELAARVRATPVQVRASLVAAQRRLLERARETLEAARAEGHRIVAAHEGLATADHLPPASVLHHAAGPGGDAALPLRLLCFCYPDEFSLLGTAITCAPPRTIAAVRRALRAWRRQRRFPASLADFDRYLADRGLSVGRGLLRHLLRQALLSVAAEPGRDPAAHVITALPDAVADRVEDILRESAEPMLLDDLVFHYRDRHDSCHKGRLLEHLRADPRMLELGPELWSLRERHGQQLAHVADEARRVVEKIHELGGRHDVRVLVADQGFSELQVYLLLSYLRRDPTLRDLGRGEFCPRDHGMSGVMQQICADLRRAMGELPVWRFLENQVPERRELIERLLRENRLFVEPRENRIDLLAHYPFNAERLLALCEQVDAFAASRGGYAPLSEVLAAVMPTELGGSFLTEHLLGDLLRRHGSFEVLPGGIIAQASLGLGGWIQRKAREVLRDADLPLAPGEIIAELPELGEFSGSLQELLERDPLVASDDSMHYRVV